MGQVRKDILNGWKEIGAYVCRDIRTVERWEKQRGLPVRRMPGAGRATVYALISELDEWLESADSEQSLEASGADFDFPARTEQGSSLDMQVSAGLTEPAVSTHGAQVASAQQVQNANSVHLLSEQSGTRSAAPIYSRQRWLSAAVLAVMATAACALAWPVIRSHANPLVGRLPEAHPHPSDEAVATYRSRVAGVDDLYLRGTYAYEQRTPESLRRSVEDFSAASAKDPGYAPAYAGLANAYNLLREYSVMPDAEAYPKAKQAAEHAISLDPRLPEAHASLGFIDFFWSWNATAAEHEFQTALSLDPNSVLAHHWYGSILMHEGRFAQAIEQLEIAQRLQPNSAAILSTRALAMGLDGHRSEAIEILQDVVRETPGSSSPHAILATLSVVEPRDPGRYLAETRRSAEMRHDVEALQVSAEAATAYRFRDEKQMWQTILATEERLHPGATHRTYLMADAEAALGRPEEAFADLALLVARHDPAVVGIRIDPILASLHSDRRFAQLVTAVGLPAS